MKKYHFFILTALTIAIGASNCRKPLGVKLYYSIWIKNETASRIFYLLSYNFPDTTMPDSFEKVQSCAANTRVSNDSGKEWEKVFKDDIPSGKLIVFIFNDQPRQDNWQQIRDNNVYAKRYQLTVQELKSTNWQIVYP